MLRSLLLVLPLLAVLPSASPTISPAAAQAAPAQEAALPTQPSVTLRREILVDGDIVRLGDIFSGLDERASIAVVRAPALGKRVPVGPRWLTAVAQKYSVPWRPQSRLDAAVIERASQILSSDRIGREIEAALVERGLHGEFSLELDNPGVQVRLPREQDASLRIAGLSYNQASGRFAAQIVAPAEGAPLVHTTVNGRAVEVIEVPVLRRRMTPGETIGFSDIEWVRKAANRLVRNVVLDSDAIVGKSPRRPIRANTILKSGDLEAPTVVGKNSLVIIRLATDRMVLTAQGRALEAGAQGDVIRVVNTKSKTVIAGTVTGPGIVKVAQSDNVVTN